MKKTRWFRNGEQPSMEGVYQVSCQKNKQSGIWFSHWNGKDFGPFILDAHRAKGARQQYGRKHSGSHVLTQGSWRGLASNPKDAQ